MIKLLGKLMLPLDTWMKLNLCHNICWKTFQKLMCRRWVQILCLSLEILNPETSSNDPSVLTVLNHSADNSSQFPGAFWLQMSSSCWSHHHSVKHFFCPLLLRWAGQTFPWSWSYSDASSLTASTQPRAESCGFLCSVSVTAELTFFLVELSKS